MNDEDSDLNVSSLAESSVRPLTESIYPVQAPYGDLHGLTPPPEDFDYILRDCNPSVLSKHYTEPPTPPRTEAVSSPSRSLQSERSSSAKLESYSPQTNPTSPRSDALMDNDMDLGRLSPGLFPSRILDGSSSRNITPSAVDHHIDNMVDVSDFTGGDLFFDFNSAASSPKPTPPNTFSFGQPQSRELQGAFFQPVSQLGSEQIQPPIQNVSRKRSRDNTDLFSLDGNFAIEAGEDSSIENSPLMDVKMEFPSASQLGSTNFGDPLANFAFQSMGSPQGFNFNQSFQTSFATNIPSSQSYETAFPGRFEPKYQLTVDFPKHAVRGSSAGFGELQVKSRVETQIAVRFTLSPPPESVAKLRLPRHAISKIKYIEDSHPKNSPDTLELLSTLVCASAMAMKDQLERALCEARGAPVPAWVTKEQNNRLERLVLDAAATGSGGGVSNGGQRRRSTSRRNSFSKEERRKILDYTKPVFGAPVQICEQCMNRERKRAGRKKNKKPEEEQKWAEDEKKRIIVFNTNQVRQFEPAPNGSAIAAETQMRICCYCRHHGEKDGFRVIFTLKDHTGAVVAQTISSTIVITDDHKNTAAAAATMLQPVDTGIMIPVDQGPHTPPQYSHPSFMAPQMQEVLPSYHQARYPNGPQSSSSGSPQLRPSSTSGAHQPKRRKGSKVPTNLTMTQAEPSAQFHGSYDNMGMSYSQQPSGGEIRRSWMNRSLSPMSQPNEAFFGTWSPSNGNGIGMLKSPRISNAPKMFGRQGSANLFSQQQAFPQVGRVVPAEGTCRGGIEITILGRDFVNGLTVLFGDIPATDTSFYSDTTLLCRLPPNATPGAVVVSLKNIDSSFRHDAIPLFTYIDDVEKELMALALTVVGLKMKGGTHGMGTSKQIALSILRDNGIAPDVIEGTRNNTGNQRTDLESTLLSCLDVIDMDESPHPAALGLKNKSGQTMLHLACMLGMQKFVAALLARGVHPNTRDRSGYTPLHFAALYKRSDVVRRLLMNRADAGLRTRGGDTAADLGESDQIVRATRSVHHMRSQSSRSSSRSRATSISSIVASLPPARMRDSVDDFYISSDDLDNSNGDSDDDSEEAQVAWASRRASIQELPTTKPAFVEQISAMEKPVKTDAPMNTSTASPPAIMAAWMDAWKEQLTHSLQNLQLNMPTIPTAADYQTLFQNHMARFQNPMPRFQNPMPRFQNPMPKWNNFKPAFSQQREDPDYKWSELFHPPAPPAYNELYPNGNEFGGQPPEKIMPVEDMPALTKPSEVSKSIPSRSSSPGSTSMDLREIHRQITRGDKTFTEAQQAQYRAHVRKMKRIKSDRRLYFFWIPVLIVILLLMALNRGPQAWDTGMQVVSFVKQAAQEPAAVRDRLRLAAARALGVPS